MCLENIHSSIPNSTPMFWLCEQVDLYWEKKEDSISPSWHFILQVQRKKDFQTQGKTVDFFMHLSLEFDNI